MRDDEYVAFLQWALPKMGLSWRGFRRVRRQVIRRIKKRLGELDVRGLDDYRRVLDERPDEWAMLDALCRVTISRFYRDRAVFDAVRAVLLPRLIARARRRHERKITVSSAGCASGEEPYTLAMCWLADAAQGASDIELSVRAFDAGEAVLQRARAGVYHPGSCKDLPEDFRKRFFRSKGELWEIAEPVRRLVSFYRADIREPLCGGPFDIVACRNLAFTYLDSTGQIEVGQRIARALTDGGYLILGGHESLPAELEGTFCPLPQCSSIYVKGNGELCS